jgi:branched-chain amino acid transport system substrate-binding protein
MRRRDLLKYAGATALAAPFIRTARADQTIKVGVVGAKTGPLAPGAAVTHFPPWRLWAQHINAKGGLMLKGGPRKVELIEYDDRTQPPEAIKAVERLAAVDKADWIAGLYGTGFNVAAVPTFAKLGYPQIPVACVTELGPQLVQKYPLLFFGNGTLTHYATTTIDILKKFRAAGQIGNKVAMVNIADEYGIEISNISKTAFPAAGFEHRLQQIIPARHAGLCAGHQGRQGDQSGRVHRLVLSAGHLRLDRTGQDRRLQCAGVLQRHRLRLPGLLRETRRRRGEHSRLGRRSRQR